MRNLISVVIPVYNDRENLKKCISSLLCTPDKKFFNAASAAHKSTRRLKDAKKFIGRVNFIDRRDISY